MVATDKLAALNLLYDNPAAATLEDMGYVQIMVLYGDESTSTKPVKTELRKRDKTEETLCKT